MLLVAQADPMRSALYFNFVAISSIDVPVSQYSPGRLRNPQVRRHKLESPNIDTINVPVLSVTRFPLYFAPVLTSPSSRTITT